MTDDYEIKLLGPGDAKVMETLLTVFAEVFEDPQAYQSAPPQRAYLDRLLDQETFIALVATDRDRTVAGLTAYVLEKFEQERREIYIYDLAVLASHRRQGIATALIRTLQEVAADKNAYVIFVQADLADAPAIALYAKLGTMETVKHFDFPVRSRN